jgi:hypothetical protein
VEGRFVGGELPGESAGVALLFRGEQLAPDTRTTAPGRECSCVVVGMGDTCCIIIIIIITALRVDGACDLVEFVAVFEFGFVVF